MLSRHAQRPISFFTVLILFFASVSTSADPTSALLISPPAYEQARLSPDGQFIAYTVDTGEKEILVVATTQDMKILRTTRLPSPRSIGQFYWIGPNRLVFNTHVKIGSIAAPNETGSWQAIDADGSHPRQILDIKYTDMRYQVVDPLLGEPVSLIMSGNGNAGSLLVKINTLNGERQILHQTALPGCTYFLSDLKQPAILSCHSQSSDTYRPSWTQYTIQSQALVPIPESISIIGNSHMGIFPAIKTSPAGDQMGTFELANQSFNPLSPVLPDSIGNWLVSNTTLPIAAVTESDIPKTTYIASNSATQALKAAQSAYPGQYVEPISTTQSESLTLLSISSDKNPGQLVLQDRTTGQFRPLMTKYPTLDLESMASTQPIIVHSRSGISLHAYLTLPNTSSNPPLIVLPHGGPIGVRDRWLFDWERQWLANQGFAVLQVNFRGSAGYGQAFQELSFGQWNTGIVDDILDATHQVISAGQIDSDRICIYGSSFGAYAAVMAAAREPELFRCVVGQAGPYSPEITLKRSDTAQTETGRKYLQRSFGHSPVDRAKADATQQAARIKGPVFLIAGQNDRRVPVENTLALTLALEQAGNPPQTLILPDQGHGFIGDQARARYYQELRQFLSEALRDP